jgi:hypothetical protein
MSGRNTETADRKFRLLIMSSDKFPPRRVDVAVLFGEKLAERNHRIDWILQSESPCDRSYEQEWGGGRAYIGPTDLGTTPLSRLRKHLLSIRHDLKVLGRARSGDYDVIKVRDKFIGGVIALVAAKLLPWLEFVRALRDTRRFTGSAQ